MAADLTTRLLDAAENLSALLREAADAESAARTSEVGLDIIKGIKAGKVYGTTPDGCIAEMSLSQADLSRIAAGVARTAEDERRDVLAYLACEEGIARRSGRTGIAATMSAIAGDFATGLHEGSADR